MRRYKAYALHILPAPAHRLSSLAKLTLVSLVPLLLLLIASFPPAPQAQTTVRAQTQGVAVKPPPVPQSPPQVCSTCGGSEDKQHTLAASYYSIRDGYTATLLLNNKGPKPLEIKPTLFSLDGQRLDLPPITVEGLTFREIDLREFGIAGTAFERGSLQLFHLGKDLVLGAQVRLTDEAKSLLFEEKLLEISTEIGAQRLEGLWYLPSHKGEVHLILSNTSDTVVAARVQIDGAATKPKESVSVTLAPHETRVLDARQDILGREKENLKKTGGITVEHASPSGSLLARVLMDDAATGYSSSMRFYDPKKAKSTMLHGAGLRLGEVAGRQLLPVVLARNVGATTTNISGRIPFTKDDGQTDQLTLPVLRLKPGETKLVDTPDALLAGIAQSIATAGLEFEYTGEPGSVIMLAQSMSEGGDLAFQVPMWDIKAQRSSTGGYPWNVNGDLSTFVYIKNVTDHKQEYMLEILSDGAEQPYRPGLKSIEGGQTVMLDIRKLRDEQVPDALGNTIPAGAIRGQIQWSLRGIEQLPMVGRSEQVDVARRWSFSYACMNCCPDQPWSWGMTSSPDVIVNIGGAGFYAYEGMTTCYGGTHGPYGISPTNWWVMDEDPELLLANIDGSGWLTSNFSGDATVYAEYESYWISSDGLSCTYNPYTSLVSGLLSILSPVDFIDASTEGDTSGFPPPPANFTNLNVDCSGARFKVRVRFRPPYESSSCCNNPISSFVKLWNGADNKFEFAYDPITDTNGYAFYGNDNPPYVDIYLRRKSGNVGTQERVGVTVGGSKTNGTPYSGTGIVRLQCN